MIKGSVDAKLQKYQNLLLCKEGARNEFDSILWKIYSYFFTFSKFFVGLDRL